LEHGRRQSSIYATIPLLLLLLVLLFPLLLLDGTGTETETHETKGMLRSRDLFPSLEWTRF
jgi:hypothetical protein